jgi:RNA polymerase sigma-70 factor (ECF subfamily)
MSESDAERVRASLAGDRSAFGDLYDRHARWVRAVLYDASRNLRDAQDLGQEVFLRAYRGLGDLRDPERFAPWLMGITRAVALDWLRRRVRDRHEYVGCDLDCPAPAETQLDDESIRWLREAVQSLPERERLAVYVFYLQSRSAEDAQAVLNLSRAGLYRLLGRARKRLERIMKRRWESAL